ncbi:MAG: hypothetical protein M3R61_04810 [Chloroflexota bacterium]|nr:hypothetical protein [Chloroflexota bacterium]
MCAHGLADVHLAIITAASGGDEHRPSITPHDFFHAASTVAKSIANP